MRFPLAKPGLKFIFAAVFLSCIVSVINFNVSIVFWLVTLFILNFFRDPERVSLESEAAVLSPADGKVIHVGAADADGEHKGYSRISIFMNVFNVHVNRAPVRGTISSVTHRPGKYHPADRPEAETENERVSIELKSSAGMFTVHLVAGLIARRIVPYVDSGNTVERGERIGMIRFGSRVDILMPANTRVEVTVGDPVRAGITRLGTLIGEQTSE